MKDVCVIIPSVKGEESKLYLELLEFTAEDRKLTNFLYAVSQHEDIKKQFTTDQFNSQGEINAQELIKKFSLEDIINQKARLNSVAKSLGAIDSKNRILYYKDVEDIIQRVIDFNKSEENIKAYIKNAGDSYYIEVNTINSINFNSAYTLEVKQEQFKSLITYLKGLGLNTENYTESFKLYFNPLNVINNVQDIKDIFSKTKLPLTKSKVEFIINNFSDNNFIKRLLTASTIEEIIQDFISYSLDNLDDIDISRRRLIEGFYNSPEFKNIQNKVDNKKLADILTESKEKVKTSTYLKIPNLEIKDILKELDAKFNINEELIEVTQGKINSLSQIAKELYRLKVHELNYLRKKGHKVKAFEKLLIKKQKEFEQGKYLTSIIQFLEDINKDIQDTQRAFILEQSRFKTLFENANDNFKEKGSIEHLKSLCAFINMQKYNISSYKDIITKMVNIELYEKDVADLDPEILQKIKEIATELNQQLSIIENNLLENQFDILYALLKPYWGEDKVVDGELVKLEDLVRVARTDINVFDRLIYSVTQCNDEAVGLLGQVFKQVFRERDLKVRQYFKEIDTLTKELYNSGSDSSFMFIKDENGKPAGQLINPYNYKAYYNDRQAYIEELKKQNLSKYEFGAKLRQWEINNTQEVDISTILFETKPDFKYSVVVPINKYKIPTWGHNLSSEQKKYYDTMMTYKAEVNTLVGCAAPHLFSAIQISASMTERVSRNNIGDMFKATKDEIVSLFKQREDESEYGGVNTKYIQQNIGPNGEELLSLPLFFTHEITDKSRLSMDFSKGMLAYLSAGHTYSALSDISDPLLLAKDTLMARKVTVTKGAQVVGNLIPVGRKHLFQLQQIAAEKTSVGDLIEDVYNVMMYNRQKKQEYVNKWRYDKTIDAIIGYNSVTGLAVNFTGAIANVIIGKLQMIIEAGGGEFFNFKDYLKAEQNYTMMLTELLPELAEPRKNSTLGKLFEYFDVSDSLNSDLRNTEFFKNSGFKLLNSANVLFLYGCGEHLLRGQGMLACLNHVKVKDSSGKETTLLEALKSEKGRQFLDQGGVLEGFTTLSNNPINDEFMDIIKKRVSYTNRSMHGAFGEHEKGMIHRYAIGRLVMNFRQWMPAHYSRRFRGKYYDAELGEYREGFYITTGKFLYNLYNDFKHSKLDIAARWHELKQNEMEFANVKRTIAEITLIALVTLAIRCVGDEDDYKDRYSYRQLIYQLKRAELELGASSPINPLKMIDNIVTMLNSPIAAIKVIDWASSLLRLDQIFETIEAGKYKGENRYLHNVVKNVPFYGQIKKQLDLGTEHGMFSIFD